LELAQLEPKLEAVPVGAVPVGTYTWHWSLHLALEWRLLVLESTLGTGLETGSCPTGDYTWHWLGDYWH